MSIRYPITSKEDSRQMRVAIRKVFVEVWDPIRVMDDPTWPRDEYDAYIGRVFELLVSGGSDEQIAEHLRDAVACMGMDGSRASFSEVIAALRQIPIPNR
jgi:hypothetical protein